MFLFLSLVLLTLTMPSEGVLEAKIVGVSVAVAALLQVCKQAPVLAPYLKGWIAVAVNVVLSVVGVYAVTPAAQVFTLQTFVTVLTAALAAAGVHGTATKMAAYHQEAKMAKLAKLEAAQVKAADNMTPIDPNKR
jgi:hypothetical protein